MTEETPITNNDKPEYKLNKSLVDQTIPNDEYLRMFGINRSNEVFLPSRNIRQMTPKYGEGDQVDITIYDQDNVLLYQVGDDGPETIFSPEPEFFETLKDWNLTEDEKQAIIDYSKAACVIDIVGKGALHDNQHYLSRLLIVKGVFDIGLSKPNEQLGIDEDLDLVEKFEQLHSMASGLFDQLGFIDERSIPETVLESISLEKSILTQDRSFVELITSNDVRSLTILLGSRAAWVMAGQSPNSSDHALAISSFDLEFPPETDLDTQISYRNQFGNVSTLYRDIIFQRIYPNSFAWAEQALRYKFGTTTDIFWRRFFVAHSPTYIELFGLKSLTDIFQKTKKADISTKSPSSLLKRAVRRHSSDLYQILLKNRKKLSQMPSEETIEKLTSSTDINRVGQGISGLESALVDPQSEDFELLMLVRNYLQHSGDDIRARVFVNESQFDQLVTEINSAIQQVDSDAAIIVHAYTSEGKPIPLTTNPDISVLTREGSSPSENFEKIRDEMFDEARQISGDENPVLFYSLLYTKQLEPEKGTTVELQISLDDEDYIRNNWRSKVFYEHNMSVLTN